MLHSAMIEELDLHKFVGRNFDQLCREESTTLALLSTFNFEDLSVVNETEICLKLHTITITYAHIISLLTPENDNYKPTEEINPITSVQLIRKPSLKILYEIHSSKKCLFS